MFGGHLREAGVLFLCAGRLLLLSRQSAGSGLRVPKVGLFYSQGWEFLRAGQAVNFS